MMSKECFCKALRMIKEQQGIDEQFGKALSMVGDGHFAFGTGNRYLIALLDVLKEAVGDQYDYIDWWLYEATEDYIVWEADETKKYCLKEPEDLYDYITGIATPLPDDEKRPVLEEVRRVVHRLPPLSELERIEQCMLGEKLDEILDRIDREDIAFVITEDSQDKVVICPFRWYAENFPDEVPESLK